MKNIVILNFSGRKTGNCSAISDYIKTFYAEANVMAFHIDQTFGTCGCCDYECLKPGVRCPNVSSLQTEAMDAVCGADLVYYIVPNYCGLPSANYYAFNERCVGYFNMDRELTMKHRGVAKRFIIVSNTETDQFMQAMKMQSGTDPDMLYMKTGKYGKKSTTGDILDSDAAKADLDAYLAVAPL